MVGFKICIFGMRASRVVFEYTGGLVGYSAGARFENLSVTGSVISSDFAANLGGLVGWGEDVKISRFLCGR